MKEITQKIAFSLKALRQARGWSLDKTAQETGVSKAMLGQIERGESSPTISTLWKIANGFQTSFSSLIEDIEPVSKKLMHRSGLPKTLHPSDEKIRVMPLFPYEEDLYFEMFMIELLPGCEHLSPAHAKGVIEHVVVIEGNMEIFVEGAWHSLNKDEGFRFQANQPHGYRNVTKQLAVIHNIIHYPKPF